MRFNFGDRVQVRLSLMLFYLGPVPRGSRGVVRSVEFNPTGGDGYVVRLDDGREIWASSFALERLSALDLIVESIVDNQTADQPQEAVVGCGPL